MIDFITKLAGYLTIFLLFRHLAKFGPAHADERALYFFTAARTAVADFTGLQKIYLKAIEHRADDVLEAHALIQHSSHALQLCQIGLQLVNVGILHARHKLHEPAAGALDRAVGIHEHAERARRRNLLALREIAGQVLGNLAVDERNRCLLYTSPSPRDS
mgnify:CR=1 FL=1